MPIFLIQLLISFSLALDVGVTRYPIADDNITFVNFREFDVISCIHGIQDERFTVLSSVTKAYYDMVFVSNDRLPSTVSYFHYFLIYGVGVGAPVIVLSYIGLCYFVVWKGRGNVKTILGGIEGQLFFFSLSLTQASFFGAIGMPLLGISTLKDELPWFVFVMSCISSFFTVWSILFMFGMRKCCCTVQGYIGFGRDQTRIAEEQQQKAISSALSDIELSVSRSRSASSSVLGKRRVVYLTNGRSAVIGVIGLKWSDIMSRPNPTDVGELSLLAKNGLIYEDGNGLVAANQDAIASVTKFNFKDFYNVNSSTDMSVMMFELLNKNKKISRVVEILE